MKIEKIIINEIGTIKHFEIEDFTNNIIIIQGDNGSGKTTALTALYSLFNDEELFYHDTSLNLKRDKFPLKSYIELFFKINENTFILKKDFQRNNFSFQLLSALPFKDMSKVSFKNVYFFNIEKLKIDFTLKQFEHILKFKDKYEINIGNCLRNYSSYKFMSSGELAILNILYFLSCVPNNSIVLADSILSRLDHYSCNEILKLFKKLAYIQFIITMPTHYELGKEFTVYKLGYNREISNDLRIKSYDLNSPELLEEDTDNNETIHINTYKLGEKVEYEENTDIEFKEVKGLNPCKSIISLADQYIVAFLNSPSTGIGAIKWGIDNNGIVRGVKLSRSDKDVLRTTIQSLINNITPPLTSNICDLQFQTVLDSDGRILEDIYVVELKVTHNYSKNLYATGKEEVYIKRNGTKQKLKPYQIQLEVLQRNKK